MDDDDAIMESERRRRRRRRGSELAPPSSHNTPRSLLSRLLLLLPLRRASPSAAAAAASGDCGGRGSEGFGCRVRIPGYCSHGTGTREKGNGGGDDDDDDDDDEEEEEEGGVEVRGPCDRDQAAEIGGGGVGSGEDRSKEISIYSGNKPEDVCLTLGMGVSLVFLLTKSATELNKITELRTEMEMLLVGIRNEIQKKNVSLSVEKSNNAPVTGSSSYGNINRGDSVSFQEDGSSHYLEMSQCTVNPSTNPKCGSIRVDQIEAELEVELELLQFNMNGKNSVHLPSHGELEPENGKSNLSESLSVSCGDDNDAKGQEVEEKDGTPHCGVSARELERRLHELLETRQQERIEELESALACAQKKLCEKEREIYWWRDTTRLASQHKDEALFR